MKYIIFTILVIAAFQFTAAQGHRQGRFGGPPNERIEELQKIKLIEVLRMNEETTLKFFARRSQHKERMQELNAKGDKILTELESKVKDGGGEELNGLISAYLENEQKINDERNAFINSLSNILSTEQIASLLVFEQRFREEIRDIILRDRRQRKN